MVNLDTHILIYALEGRLEEKEKALLLEEEWGIASIVLWELAKLRQLDRIRIDLDDGEVIRSLDRLHVWPLTRVVAETSVRLDFRADPADELIAATSIVNGVDLVTRDTRILGSRVVPLAEL